MIRQKLMVRLIYNLSGDSCGSDPAIYGPVHVQGEPWADYSIRTTVTLSLSDDDFGKLASGKTQAQRLFMSGKLKIKGDVMKVC